LPSLAKEKQMPRVSEIEEDGDDPTLKAIFDRQRDDFAIERGGNASARPRA